MTLSYLCTPVTKGERFSWFERQRKRDCGGWAFPVL